MNGLSENNGNRPSIRLPVNGEIRKREARWKMERMVELLIFHNDKLTWTLHDDFRWTLQVGDTEICLDRVLADKSSPEDTPHQLRLQCYSKGYRDSYWRHPDPWYTVVGGDPLNKLQTLVSKKTDDLLDRLLASLTSLPRSK